ncbi:MAG: outer membrane beta-barrel protein [Gammaproteobacteria bacterium]|nr:outer membrane beta-barrel protein [Gammaproteobacteria bacterium]
MLFKNRVLFSSVIALSSSFVLAAPGDYLNAQLAISDVTGFNSGLSLAATYGHPLASVHKNLSFEAEFTSSVTKPETNDFFLGKINVSYYTLAGYGVYAQPINDKLGIRGRIGVLYEHVTVSQGGFSGFSGSGTDTGISLGGGITYAIDNKMNFIAEYTIIESDISHLSAGIQYKF